MQKSTNTNVATHKFYHPFIVLPHTIIPLSIPAVSFACFSFAILSQPREFSFFFTVSEKNNFSVKKYHKCTFSCVKNEITKKLTEESLLVCLGYNYNCNKKQ